MLGHDQTYLAQPQNAVRLTRIDTNAVGIVSFGIDQAARESVPQRRERRRGIPVRLELVGLPRSVQPRLRPVGVIRVCVPDRRTSR